MTPEMGRATVHKMGAISTSDDALIEAAAVFLGAFETQRADLGRRLRCLSRIFLTLSSRRQSSPGGRHLRRRVHPNSRSNGRIVAQKPCPWKGKRKPFPIQGPMARYMDEKGKAEKPGLGKAPAQVREGKQGGSAPRVRKRQDWIALERP